MNRDKYSSVWPGASLVLRTVALSCLAFAAMSGSSSSAYAQDQPTSSVKASKPNIELAAKIRKAIVADKTLSMAAHNVRVVAGDSVVTISGQVKSDDERMAVLQKAKDIAGGTQVSDQMTVAAQK